MPLEIPQSGKTMDKVSERRPRDDPKPRDKAKEDIPFPVIYFGFILGFVLWNRKRLYAALPSVAEHSASRLIPDLSTALLPAFAFFVVCPILFMWRGLVKRVVFSPMAEKWAGLKRGTAKHDKFCEQGWLAVHYSVATSVGLYVLREKPWWPPTISERAMIAVSAPQAERELDHGDNRLRALYSLQLGFYTLELMTLLMTKHRRSDAVVYFFHHIFTMFLMAGSWVSYNHRIGTLVLFLHDIGDIFLPIGKCYTYAEDHIRMTRTKTQYEFHKMIGMFFFVLFVIGFAVPRLILYGGLIYQGFFTYSWYKCCGIDPLTGDCAALCAMGPTWSTTLLTVLGLLYPMHVYWFYLIVKMAIRLVLHPGHYDDVRSDDDKQD